jgi:GT2 family glycosyltransferase
MAQAMINKEPKLSISIVSHGQMALIAPLLADIARFAGEEALELILTLNLPEDLPFADDALAFPLKIIRNAEPMGFGANHNQAFHQASGEFFCVLNPDVRLTENVFSALRALFAAHGRAGVVAPRVLRPDGAAEDSARYFPTPLRLAAKALHLGDGRFPVAAAEAQPVDWVAGMFMLFRADAFRQVGGFDEGFFLYYEDVDICARLWRAGWSVLLLPGVSVVHAAQRSSRRDRRYLAWHLSSMLRYFLKHLGRLPKIPVGLL